MIDRYPSEANELLASEYYSRLKLYLRFSEFRIYILCWWTISEPSDNVNFSASGVFRRVSAVEFP